ncbi:DUF1667 domain-containing protein [Caldicellulosiruptoraceae bacterium PP1]
MEKSITCISCPMGCIINYKKENDNNITFSGYKCKRGLEYAKQELTSPKRIVTTTIKLNNASLPFLPVKTDKPIPKDKIDDVLNILRDYKCFAPIKAGDIVIENILNTGANIVATRSINN